MRRRDFLAFGAMMAGTLAARRALAQVDYPLVRGAVVIGVNKAGSLPVLRAAASGARQFADWLQGEDFEVKLFVDDDGSVVHDDVYRAVDEFVGRRTLDQLVIYFSGHGFLKDSSEVWFLSRAPGNPNEAIQVYKSIFHARLAGIRHVVFVSDTCRSTPDSLQISEVNGGSIFPNMGPVQRTADIDEFYATVPGHPAWEIPISDSVERFQGIYTSCFLDAFKYPDKTMVLKLENGVEVVPNRNLEDYLASEVPKRSPAVSINQKPESRVECKNTDYIGRVISAGKRVDAQVVPATLGDIATLALNEFGLTVAVASEKQANESAIARLADEIGFSDAVTYTLEAGLTAEGVLMSNLVGRSIVDSGFLLSGASVGLANVSAPVEATVVSDVEVHINLGIAQAATVLIRFADGSGTLVAALKGFIGLVVVDQGAVTHVSYVPTSDEWYYQSNYELGGVIATAARFGAFSIRGDRESRERVAAQLKERVYAGKKIDPTLGLYAAYAFAEAGLVGELRSLQAIVREALRVDLFDIALIADFLSENIAEKSVLVPFCPLLSRGWDLLGADQVKSSPMIAELRPHLRPALWTTLNPSGVEAAIAVLRER